MTGDATEACDPVSLSVPYKDDTSEDLLELEKTFEHKL
jgi:hypothetical protein